MGDIEMNSTRDEMIFQFMLALCPNTQLVDFNDADSPEASAQGVFEIACEMADRYLDRFQGGA